ncbi:Putative thymidylate kinase [Acidilobus saccharovorans 345-15]|uniref:Probable thymidylate kinase n=1 Tax=Acidilobus saccharovorans (strain DSM 16705 / JCM 18335 / VKM B-2471 / 345-15) TaxID=666510 RepID=D9Q373_ACIS3|nr:dTMP kinase [Acidilobus saccharovorans]ADL19761.1 Putative thymidylate kinase [Acidilobus saccharovorans 345-15]
MKGAIVALEGIDGSGITTHSKLLAQRLSSMGYRAIYTKEPTEGPVGQVIRQLLAQGRPEPRLAALLFAADRSWHLCCDPSLPGGVMGALEQGYVVVMDRYKYSSIAYQGASGADPGWLWEVNSFAPEADLLIFIDVPVEVALSRVAERQRREGYEVEGFLRRAKERFYEVLAQAEARGVTVVRLSQVKDDRPLSVDEFSSLVLEEALRFLKTLR